VMCRANGDDTQVFALTCLHNIDLDYLPSDPITNWLGRRVGHPDGKDSCCKSSSHIFGSVFNVSPVHDAAIIKVNPGKSYLREIEQVGLVKGAHPLEEEETNGAPFLVRKRGAATSLTGGWIAVYNTSTSISVRGHTVPMRGVHIVKPNDIPAHPEGGVFAIEGDSGAAVVGDDGRVIGLLFGGINQVQTLADGHTKVISFAAVIPIQKIVDDLKNDGDEALRIDLEVMIGTQPGEELTVPKPAAHPMVAEVDELEPAPLEEDVRRTRIGGWYADLYYRYRDEIEALINGNRHVAAVWHRRGGAALMHAFGRVLRLPAERVPATLDGRSLSDCLATFARTLLRFGSEPLRRDLIAVQPTLPDVGGLCYTEILEVLAAADRAHAPAVG
jgi:hypothetical protein